MVCNICPRKCNILRSESIIPGNGEGFCNMGVSPVIAKVGLHKWEEPCISGENGSGTIFFSGCNMKCVFCQNYKISNNNYGKEISTNRLYDLYLDLISQGAHNINLVNPTHFVKPILESLNNNDKLPIPIVYNSNGYEDINTIKSLDNKIQIYMPDLKYSDNSIAFKYSKTSNYFEIATNAIEQMYKQVGNYEIDNYGMLKKGVIVRHLIIPNNINNTLKVIDWINDNFKKGTILFSLMSQYIPCGKAYTYKEISKKISKKEYYIVEQYLFDSGFEDGYIQDLDAAKYMYIPEFNYI